VITDETQPIANGLKGNRFAKLVSYSLHPLLMPTYGFMILFFSRNYISTFTPMRIKVLLIAITFFFTFFLPAVNTLILLRIGRVKSLEMELRKERRIPYSITLLYYFPLLYLFYNADFPSVYKILILGATISLLFTLLINNKWKISAHTVGIGGIAGAILGIMFRLQLDMQFVFMLSLLVAGIVGYARLKLNSHTPAQVYCGFVLGFVVEFLLMIFYR